MPYKFEELRQLNDHVLSLKRSMSVHVQAHSALLLSDPVGLVADYKRFGSSWLNAWERQTMFQDVMGTYQRRVSESLSRSKFFLQRGWTCQLYQKTISKHGRVVARPGWVKPGTFELKRGTSALIRAANLLMQTDVTKLNLFECFGRAMTLLVPLDEYLFESLRAGDSASTRDATFTKTRAQLQAETRAVIEHGVPPNAETPVVEVYTLPRASVPGLWGKRRAVHDGSRLVTLSSHSARNSPVGMLPNIADYLAPELASNVETWLKVPLPFKLGSLVDGEEFRLRLVRRNEHACSQEPLLPTSLVVTGKWFIFRVKFETETERELLKTWMADSLGRVALEQPWSGYLKTVIIECADNASWTSEDELQQLVDQAPETVDVYDSSALDALSWQLLERDVEHRVGPAGGLVSLVG